MTDAPLPRMVGSLGELEAMPGMPSIPTLKKMIAEHHDFPVLKRGTNGVAYEFDLAEAHQFVCGVREREEAEARSRAVEVRQLGLSLLGGQSLASPAEVGLSPSERKALLEEELVAIKVAEKRGLLIDKASVEEAVSSFLVRLDQSRRSFTARLTKRVELDREQIAAIEAVMRQDQVSLAGEMERLEQLARERRGDDEDGEDAEPTEGRDPADGDGL